MRPGTVVRDLTRPQLGIGIVGRPCDRFPGDTAVWVYWPRGRRRATTDNLGQLRNLPDPDRLPGPPEYLGPSRAAGGPAPGTPR